MQRHVMWLFLVATVLVPALGGAVTEADFEVKTTQNLLNLCTAAPNDPRYREAIHFCHGYLVGAYHYHVAQTVARVASPWSVSRRHRRRATRPFACLLPGCRRIRNI